MKMKPASLLAVAEISCHYYAQGSNQRLDAKLAFATMEAVQSARLQPPSQGAAADISYGDIVVVRQTEAGGQEALIQPLGRHGAYFVDVPTDAGARPVRITGSGMLSTREALLDMVSSGMDIGEDARRSLAGIQFIFELACTNPDTRRYGTQVVADAFVAAMTDGGGRIELPVSADSFARKARADLMRAEIGLIDPSHRDALVRNHDLERILEEEGIEPDLISVGALRGLGGGDESMRHALRANDRLVREIFGTMTRTQIEALDLAIISAGATDELMTAMEDRILTGPWVDEARARLQDILSDAMPGYEFDFMIAAQEGRDLMIVTDKIGDAFGATYIYSWPTADRISISEFGAQRRFTISPEEVPDEEELARLAAVLERLSDAHLTDGLDNYA